MPLWKDIESKAARLGIKVEQGAGGIGEVEKHGFVQPSCQLVCIWGDQVVVSFWFRRKTNTGVPSLWAEKRPSQVTDLTHELATRKSLCSLHFPLRDPCKW